MIFLDKGEIAQLEEEIDSPIPHFSYLSEDRIAAILNVLRCYDAFMEGSATNPNPGVREIMCQDGFDALHHAMRWIFTFCPNGSPTQDYLFNGQKYSKAIELFDFAKDYSKVWDLMILLHNEKLSGHRNGNQVTVSFNKDINRQRDVADSIIASYLSPDEYVDQHMFVTEFVEKTIKSDVKIEKITPKEFKYVFSEKTFTKLLDHVSNHMARRWSMSPDWDLGGYTFGHFYRFWEVLRTFCLIHTQVCFRLVGAEKILRSIIKIQKQTEWETELARLTGLPLSIVKTILSDLVYDNDLYQKGKKSPHVTYQPFFSLNHDDLALSNWLVFISNAERNVWDLVEIKRPKLHGKLKNLKEGLWITELKDKTKLFGLNLFPTIKFQHEERGSDLDLLILDKKLKFGLVCQLKYLMIPGKISARFNNDREIKKGIAQAKHSLSWVKSYPSKLEKITGLSRGDLEQFEFRPIVICKFTLASSFLLEPGVPVINERLFEWVIGAPHYKNIKILWETAEDLKYLPKENKHFKTISGEANFDEFKFICEHAGLQSLRPWIPQEDIEFD